MTSATFPTNVTLPTVIVGPDRVHTYPGFATDCPCGAAGFPCTRWGTIDWFPTNSLGLHYANDASTLRPGNYVLTIFAYSLMAFLALRTVARTSTSALVGLCLIIGGLMYDIGLGFPGANAADTTSTTTSSTAVIASDLNTSTATAASRFNNWQCGPLDQWCTGQDQSHAVPRLAFPGFWLVMLVVLVCWLGLAVGQLHDAAVASHADSPSATIAAAPGNEPSHTVVHQALAGRFFPNEVELKRSQPAVKTKEGQSNTDVSRQQPGTIKLAILVTPCRPLRHAGPHGSRRANPNQYASHRPDLVVTFAFPDGVKCHWHIQPDLGLPRKKGLVLLSRLFFLTDLNALIAHDDPSSDDGLLRAALSR
jgi:hypothetical protein